MKKNLSILLVALGLVSLNGCSTLNDWFGDDDNTVAVDANSEQDNPDSDTDDVKDEPTADVKLTYSAKKHEIKANITTTWNGAPQGTIYLTWEAPTDTSCYNTSFPITKYKDVEDYTKDYESVISDNVVCKGTWTATITNKADDSELASQTIEIA